MVDTPGFRRHEEIVLEQHGSHRFHDQFEYADVVLATAKPDRDRR